MIELEILPARPQTDLSSPLTREWTFPDGRPWTRFHRLGDGFSLRFPDLVDFELPSAATIVRAFPAHGTSIHTVWHLFHNQVLPLVLSHQGKLVFHASAVEIDGVAIAFLGESGKGKSTLAASFARNGHAFLTDDGLRVEREGDHWMVIPSQASLRLWDDSQQAVVGGDASAAPALDFTAKGRFFAGDSLAHCSEPRRLARIYILGDGTAPTPTAASLPAADALIELVKHSFLLDTEAPALLSAHFDDLSVLVSQVPCVRYDFPRSFEALSPCAPILNFTLAKGRTREPERPCCDPKASDGP